MPGAALKFIARLVFTAETPIYIGGKREANILYNLRLANGKLLIPATTWKGALRSIAEKIAPTMNLGGLEGIAVQNITTAHDINEATKNVANATHNNVKLLDDFKEAVKTKKNTAIFNANDVYEKLYRLGYTEDEILQGGENIAQLLAEYLAFYCPVGKLFGNHVMAGSLHFLDTIYTSGLQRRTGIGIDRKKGIVKENALYTVETTDAKIQIPLVITGLLDSTGDTPSRLLASTLEYVKTLGLNIGGRKSAGLGLLTLQKAEIYAFQPGKDQDLHGEKLAFPFSDKPISIEAFIERLRLA
jgi:CRISPR/Cas system CSM-associated protein Csm3 (group 7 of RAMP superfamily)